MTIDILLKYLKTEKLSPDYLKKRYEILLGKILYGAPYYFCGNKSLFDMSNMKIENQMILRSFKNDVINTNLLHGGFTNSCKILMQSLDKNLTIEDPCVFDMNHLDAFSPLLIFNIEEICVHDDLDDFDYASCEMIYKCIYEKDILFVTFIIQTRESDDGFMDTNCNIIYSRKLKKLLEYCYTEKQMEEIVNMIDAKKFGKNNFTKRTEFIKDDESIYVDKKLLFLTYSKLIEKNTMAKHEVYEIKDDDTESVEEYKKNMLKNFESFYKNNKIYQKIHGPSQRGRGNGRSRGRGKL